MAKPKKNAPAANNDGATAGYEAQLWQMADALRGETPGRDARALPRPGIRSRLWLLGRDLHRGPETRRRAERKRLPINREDQGLDLMLRVYAPDLEKMKTWKAPKAVLVK